MIVCRDRLPGHEVCLHGNVQPLPVGRLQYGLHNAHIPSTQRRSRYSVRVSSLLQDLPAFVSHLWVGEWLVVGNVVRGTWQSVVDRQWPADHGTARSHTGGAASAVGLGENRRFHAFHSGNLALCLCALHSCNVALRLHALHPNNVVLPNAQIL